MSGVEEMIRKMESMLGTSGTPNTATRWYAAHNGAYFLNAPWCNMTITWAAYKSGNYEPVCFGTDYAYTVYHAQRFQKAGQWHVDVAGIRRGDIVFFDWQGSNSIGAIDHIGIVTGVSGPNVLTIEGNTAGTCARRVRQASSIAGYGRPKYSAAPSVIVPPAVARPVVRLAYVQPGKSNGDVLTVQKALAKEVGLNYSSGPGVFGPKTKAAYAAYQRRLGHTGSGADGSPGRDSLSRLGAKYGFTVK